MHCKSGADRAGLAAALYLIFKKDYSLEEASRELNFKHLHIKYTVAKIEVSKIYSFLAPRSLKQCVCHTNGRRSLDGKIFRSLNYSVGFTSVWVIHLYVKKHAFYKRYKCFFTNAHPINAIFMILRKPHSFSVFSKWI